MSIRIGIALAAGFFAVAGFVGQAGAEMAAPKQAKPAKVNFAACAVKAGECVFVSNKGKTYNITSAAPSNLGLKLRVSGTETTNFSSCQGTILANVKVSQTRTRCKAKK